MEDNFLLEAAKENIQPLRQGRMALKVGSALQAHSDPAANQERLKQQREFEVLIRAYEGDDPLLPWYDYVMWVEQSYPTNVHEGKLDVLLQNCLAKFKDDDQYKQDIRYVKLWIKYIELQTNPLEIYQQVYSHGIGTQSAFFYRCWAYDFEKANDFKHANEIYELGLKNNAEPRSDIEEAMLQFQLNFAQATLRGTAVPLRDPPSAEERHAFGALRARGGNKVGSLRVGSKLKSDVPGVLRPLRVTDGVCRSNRQRTSAVRIYDDENDVSEIGNRDIHLRDIPSHTTVNLENLKHAGPWTGRHKSHKVPACGPSTPTFQVHHDDETSEKERKVQRVNSYINALKTRKHDDGFKCEHAIFEPHDPTKRPMYQKHQVYAGGVEFSFEELRAVAYLKKEAKLEENRAECMRLEEQEQQCAEHMSMQELLPNSASELCSEPQNANLLPFVESSTKEVNSRKTAAGIGHKTDFAWERHKYERHNEWTGAKDVLSGSRGDSDTLMNSQNHGQIMTGLNVDREGPSQYSDEDVLESENRRAPFTLYEDSETTQLNAVAAAARSTRFQMYVDEPENVPKIPRAVKCPSFPLYVDEVGTTADTSGMPPGQVSKSAAQVTRGDNNEDIRSMWKANSFSRELEANNISEDQSLHSQSLTVNTREAIKIVSEFFVSDKKKKIDEPPYKQLNIPKFSLDTEESLSETCPRNPTGQPRHLPDEESPDGYPSVVKRAKTADQATDVRRPVAYSIKQQLFPTDDGLQTGFNSSVAVPDEAYKETGVIGETVEIPYIPSPHMTAEELMALSGTEDKENNFRQKGSSRQLAGVLQPSLNIPFAPLDEQQDESDDDLGVQPIEQTTNDTCNTQQFSFPLLSSTPFTSHMKATSSSLPSDKPVAVRVAKELNTVESGSHSAAAAMPADTGSLSVIMECSKEYRSSSSSGGSSTALSSKKTGAMGSHWTRQSGWAVDHSSQDGQDWADNRRRESLAPVQEHEEPCSPPPLPVSKTVERGFSKLSVGENYGQQDLCLNQDNKEEGSFTYITNLFRVTLQSSEFSGEVRNSNSHLDSMSLRDEPLRVDRNVTNIDPFDPHFVSDMLSKVHFPAARHKPGYVTSKCFLPEFRPQSTITLGDDQYIIKKCLGIGAYAKVYKATNVATGSVVALKVQKPSCEWEFYISRELRIRLGETLAQAYLYFDTGYFLRNGSVLVSDQSPFGTLLDVVNKLKARCFLREWIAVYLTREMIMIMDGLQQSKIIHADVKPDNFLFRSLPSFSSLQPCLQLIDFGRSIDMSLLPPGTQFNQSFTAKGFECIEMRTQRPWTYQTDLYGLAASAHILLFGVCMNVVCTRDGTWNIQSRIPRYYKTSIWRNFFTTLLNVKSCDNIPNLCDLRQPFDDIIVKMISPEDVTTLKTILSH